MNFHALQKEQYLYFKQVLGLSYFFTDVENQPKNYERLVVIDEELSALKQDLLNKILSAYAWQDVAIVNLSELEANVKIKNGLFFGTHLEDTSLAQHAQKKLFAPSLQDLIDEPQLKKLLWAKMQAEMKNS